MSNPLKGESGSQLHYNSLVPMNADELIYPNTSSLLHSDNDQMHSKQHAAAAIIHGEEHNESTHHVNTENNNNKNNSDNINNYNNSHSNSSSSKRKQDEEESKFKKVVLFPFSHRLPFVHKRPMSIAESTHLPVHRHSHTRNRNDGNNDTEMTSVINKASSEEEIVFQMEIGTAATPADNNNGCDCGNKSSHSSIGDGNVLGSVQKTLKEPILILPNSSNGSGTPSNDEYIRTNNNNNDNDDDNNNNDNEYKKLRKTGSIWESLLLSVSYTLADFKRRPRNMIIGIIAVCLLVFFTGMIISGITKTPYIILRLSEETMGEIDVLMTSDSNSVLLNYTSFAPMVARSSAVRGAAPRWVYRATLKPDMYNTNMRQNNNNNNNNNVNNSSNSSSVNGTAVNVLIIDSIQEQAIGLGRGWPYRPTGYGEAHVYSPVVEFTNLRTNVGDRFAIEIDMHDLSASGQLGNIDFTITRPQVPDVTNITSIILWLFFVRNNIKGNSVNMLDVANVHVSCTLIDGISRTFGKYPSVYGNPVILDSQRLPQYVMDQSGVYGSNVFTPRDNYSLLTPAEIFQLPESLPTSFRLSDYAMMIAIVLNDRYTMYYGTTAQRNKEMTRRTNSLFQAIGIDYAATPTFPLAVHMDTFDAFKALLIAMFIVVVIGIVVLCGILMFTLLRINSDEKQFELAMFRAQGMPRRRLTYVLVSQTLFFTLPGAALGILLAWIANIIMEAALRKFTVAPPRYVEMPIVAAVVSVVLGCALPLLATYGPAHRALHGNLRDALDVYRQVQNEAHVVKVKLAELGVTPWQAVLGVFLVVVGFMVYYLVPFSFINNDLLLFFALLDIVLLAMVVGLCMMLYVVEPYLSRFIVFGMLWGKERKLHTLVRKNMHSHAERNAKAFIMFLLTIATLTSAGVMFTQLSQVTAQLSELTAGAPITVTSSSFKTPLDQKSLDEYLQTSPASLACVDHWAYSSFPLNDYPQVGSRTTISNSITSSSGIEVSTLSRSFMASTYDKFNMISEVHSGYSFHKVESSKKKDVVRSLYDDKPTAHSIPPSYDGAIGVGYSGSSLPNLTAKLIYRVPALVGVAVKDILGSDTQSMITLQYSYGTTQKGSVSTTFQVEPRALMTRVAGFPLISKMTTGFSSSTMFVAEDDFRQLLNPILLDFEQGANVTLVNNSIEEIIQKTLYISLKRGTSQQQREALVNGLTPLLNRLLHSTVDTEQVKEQMNTVQKLIMGFFYFTAVVCIILCAFMLWVTFIANVQLHAWTFGVLRSLGFNLPQLVRAAIYEALTIVLCAFIIGIIIGVCVGLTSSAQLSIYLMLPFAFPFPYILIIVMLVLALIAAVAGSAAPFIALRTKPISEVLRGI